MHGWAISQRIQQISHDAFQVGQGSLYPALHRLEQRGLIRSEWERTDDNRRAKFYTMTATGRRALAEEVKAWRHYVGSVELILESS
jgi:transcriptional regulator